MLLPHDERGATVISVITRVRINARILFVFVIFILLFSLYYLRVIYTYVAIIPHLSAKINTKLVFIKIFSKIFTFRKKDVTQEFDTKSRNFAKIPPLHLVAFAV